MVFCFWSVRALVRKWRLFFLIFFFSSTRENSSNPLKTRNGMFISLFPLSAVTLMWFLLFFFGTWQPSLCAAPDVYKKSHRVCVYTGWAVGYVMFLFEYFFSLLPLCHPFHPQHMVTVRLFFDVARAQRQQPSSKDDAISYHYLVPLPRNKTKKKKKSNREWKCLLNCEPNFRNHSTVEWMQKMISSFYLNKFKGTTVGLPGTWGHEISLIFPSVILSVFVR